MSEELQTDTPFEPAAEFIVRDLETLRVLSNPLRLQILEHMLEPGTVKKVAAELGLAPTKLYYHVNMLEEHGLLKVTDTRVVSGIIEKRYQIIALRFQIDHSLLNLIGPEGKSSVDALSSIDAMLSSIFDLTRVEVKESLAAGLIELGDATPAHHRLSMSRSLIPLTAERAEAFYARLDELIKEFSREDKDYKVRPDEQVYGMTFAMYPSTFNPNNEETDEQPG